MKVLDRLLDLFEWLSGLVLFSIMALTVVTAAGRTFAGRPIPDDVEIVSLMYVAVIFFALAPVHKHREHVRVELIVSRLPTKLQVLFLGISLCLELLLFVLLTWQAYVNLLVSVKTGEDFGIIISVPTYPSRCALLAGCMLMLAQVARELSSLVRK